MFCAGCVAEVHHVQCQTSKPLSSHTQRAQPYLLVLGFHCCFELRVEIAEILEDRANRYCTENKSRYINLPVLSKYSTTTRGSAGIQYEWGIKGALTNLNSIVNNPQITSNAAAKEQIKGCGLHSGNKKLSLSKCLLKLPHAQIA